MEIICSFIETPASLNIKDTIPPREPREKGGRAYVRVYLASLRRNHFLYFFAKEKKNTLVC